MTNKYKINKYKAMRNNSVVFKLSPTLRLAHFGFTVPVIGKTYTVSCFTCIVPAKYEVLFHFTPFI